MPERILTTMQSTEHNSQWSGQGRHHITNIPYMLPDANEEINHLDLQHYLLRHVLKGNYLAPIIEPARILDVGTGTGRWLIEMAQEFPQAALFGVDLALPIENADNLPANCHFQAANVLNILPFKDASFDFVHQRLLIFAIPLLHWQLLIDDLVRVTRQGGWIELVEVTTDFQHVGPSTQQILNLIVLTSLQRGLDPAISQRIHILLSKAGLKHVGTSTQLIPAGTWGGQLGTMGLTAIQAIVETMKPLVLQQMQTTPEDFERLVAEMIQECEQYKTTFTFHIAYGKHQ